MSMMEKHVQETKNKKELECLTALASWFLERRKKRVLAVNKKNKKAKKAKKAKTTTTTTSRIVTTLRRETMAIALEKTGWDVEKSKAILEQFLL